MRRRSISTSLRRTIPFSGWVVVGGAWASNGRSRHKASRLEEELELLEKSPAGGFVFQKHVVLAMERNESCAGNAGSQ
jgi:hypothetical protein